MQLARNALGVVDTARALGVARQTVSRWLKTGVLPGRRDGRRWTVSLETVAALRKKRAAVARMIGTLL